MRLVPSFMLLLFRSSNDEFIGKELRRHVKDPPFLPPGFSEHFIAWIFMGSPGPGASMHVSVHTTDIIASERCALASQPGHETMAWYRLFAHV